MSCKSARFSQIFPSLIAFALTLSACNGLEKNAPQLESVALVSQDSDANIAVKPAPAPKSVPAVGNYPSCISSDPDHICIGIKVVSYLNSAGVPVLSEANAVTLVNQMNAVWSQCNIAYQLEVYQSIDPAELGMSYSPDWQNESNSVRSKFKDRARFLVVAVGPWTDSTIAVTMMPGSGVYGVLVEKDYAHNPLTVGHEIGHYQGLYHVEDTSNLMSAYIGNNTKGITNSQCSIARDTDNSNWQLMMRKTN